MKKKLTLPDIPVKDQTPTVKALLLLVEECLIRLQEQDEEIHRLKDEIDELKGEKKRPKFKPSKLDEGSEGHSDEKDSKKKKPRAGSNKKSKTAELEVHEEKVLSPSDLPEGSRFKGYRDYVVQDLQIKSHNIRYRLACWVTPDGKTITAQLPFDAQGSHVGATLKQFIIYQHHHCQVTQPLLLEQLQEWGVDISSGQINRILSEKQDIFHHEKDSLLKAGLSASSYVSVDDSGARHQGKNGYVTQIGNAFFAWFESTGSKSRINFLSLLRAGNKGYQLTEAALEYMKAQKLPQTPLNRLKQAANRLFPNDASWQDFLKEVGIIKTRHVRIATEGALLGCVVAEGVNPNLVIVSDDAGQFNVLLHALCWVHAERLIHKLIPLNDAHKEDIAHVRGQIWNLYADLKAYKSGESHLDKEELNLRFDEIFSQKTRYATLNQILKRIHANKQELLLVLERPDIPLHTNESERDIRDYVKKRKVSGGTRSELGRRCRDTFTSLKKTCRKLNISFWRYLKDRISNPFETIDPLADIILTRASTACATGY
jgi:hypothetical protein